MNLKKLLPSLIGVSIGLLMGYLYYYYVGCTSGTCSITSDPVNSSIYGGLIGLLLSNSFKGPEKRK